MQSSLTKAKVGNKSGKSTMCGQLRRAANPEWAERRLSELEKNDFCFAALVSGSNDIKFKRTTGTNSFQISIEGAPRTVMDNSGKSRGRLFPFFSHF